VRQAFTVYGLDWYVTATRGEQCTLSGPWPGASNNGGAPGHIHFDLDRNCPGNNDVINLQF